MENNQGLWHGKNSFVKLELNHHSQSSSRKCCQPLAYERIGCQNNSQKPAAIYGYGSIPIDTIFRGMNIHLPAILM